MTLQENQTSSNMTAASLSQGRSNRTWKKAAGFALSFLLFVSITGVFFSLDLWLGFFNKQTVVTAVAESAYTAGALEQLNMDLEALMKAHDLDPDPALALLDETQFYAVSGNRIEMALKGNPDGMDTTEFEETLRSVILGQLAERGIPAGTQLDQVVSEIVFAGGSLYEQHAGFQFGTQFIQAREQTLPMVRGLFFSALVLSLLLTGILGFGFRRRHAGLSLISYSLMGAVLVNALVVLLLYTTNPIGNGELGGSMYYQTFMDEYLKNSLVPGIGICLLGLILWGGLWVSIRRIQREG